MGALTVNRKRGEDYFTVKSRNGPLSIDQVLKRPRLSTSSPGSHPHLSGKSVVSRFYRYPEAVAPIRREVHAPCRRVRFGHSEKSRNSSTGGDFRGKCGSEMGNLVARLFGKAKPSEKDGSRYGAHVNEVIEIDSDVTKESVSRDGFMEDVEVVEKVSLVYPPKDAQGVVEMLENYVKNDVGRAIHPQSGSLAAELNDANMNICNQAKTSDLISTNHEFDNLGLPAYKKLLDNTEKRYDSNISRLNFQIELHEKHRQRYQLFRKREEVIKDVTTEPFVPLTDDDKAQVVQAFSGSNRGKVLITHKNSNIDITGILLQCLKPGKWLNDEVINVYLELLKERETREPKKFLKCHFFNTFFYKKLKSGKTNYNYQSVRRWTSQRKLGYGLFECDKIFVPIHKEVHWCLAVINKKDKKFQYLDSLMGRDNQVLQILARYYVDEVKDKNGEDIDVSSWEMEFVEELPEQQNGYDCGMFMIKYADFYSRNIGLCFGQEHMAYFRLRTAKEILRLKAE